MRIRRRLFAEGRVCNVRSVLVIDDEPDVRLLCRLNLRPAGIDVREVGSGHDGLAAAFEDVPDIVVLDLMMPEMDGFEVLRRLRVDARTEGIPVMVLTAKTTEIDRRRCRDLGADAYVTKPFDPSELVDHILGFDRPLHLMTRSDLRLSREGRVKAKDSDRSNRRRWRCQTSPKRQG